MSFNSSAVRLSLSRRRSIASVLGILLSEGIVSLQVVRADIEVTQSGPVGQRESERGLSPRGRRRVSRMWVMDGAEGIAFEGDVDGGGHFLGSVVVEQGRAAGWRAGPSASARSARRSKSVEVAGRRRAAGRGWCGRWLGEWRRAGLPDGPSPRRSDGRTGRQRGCGARRPRCKAPGRGALHPLTRRGDICRKIIPDSSWAFEVQRVLLAGLDLRDRCNAGHVNRARTGDGLRPTSSPSLPASSTPGRLPNAAARRDGRSVESNPWGAPVVSARQPADLHLASGHVDVLMPGRVRRLPCWQHISARVH